MNADSQQVYRGLDVGTAKPTARERAAVPHHLLDVADPGEGMDAARWLALADAAIADIAARGRLPVVVGGTGLYVRALLHGVVDAPGRDPALRTQLEEEASIHGRAGAAPASRRRGPGGRRPHPGERPGPHRARAGDRGRRAHAERALRGPPLRTAPLSLPAPRPRRAPGRAEPAHRGPGRCHGAGRASSTRPGGSWNGSARPCPASPSDTRTPSPARSARSTRASSAARISRLHRRYARRQVVWLRREQDVEWLGRRSTPTRWLGRGAARRDFGLRVL